MSRHKRSYSSLGLLTVMSLATTWPVQAEAVWALGIGLELASSPIEKDDVDISPVLIASYENDDVLGGSLAVGTTEGISYGRLFPGGLTISAFLDYRLSPLDDADGAVADGIDRDVAIEIGGRVDYLTSRGIFSASILGDVSGAHDGAEATLAY